MKFNFSESLTTFRTKNKMKFNFLKKLSKQKEVSEETRVTRVRIMAESPRVSTSSFSEPSTSISTEIAKTVQPPSPTCVKEQIQCDAMMVGGEEKEADITPQGNASFSGMDCKHSLVENNFNGNVLGEWEYSETKKRMEELREIINTKMEYMHGKIFGDLGEFAMTAVENNRNEMNQMLGKMDKEGNAVDSMDWLWNEQIIQFEYDGSIMTCNDIQAYLGSSKQTSGDEKETAVVVPHPSI